jgi:CRP-like cAMP-binding protein
MVLRRYGVDELKAGEPLTRYELENAKIAVTYRDGSTAWLRPKEPPTAALRELEDISVPGGGTPVIANVEHLTSLRLLNVVEEHALTMLYDERDRTVELCDGFYNDDLFDSPYRFGRGPIVLEQTFSEAGLIRAGSRMVIHPDGTPRQHPVHLEFLRFSRTDYDYALTEADLPGTIQLMGRIFSGDLKRERRRLDEGTSPIPALLSRIHEWQVQRQRPTGPDRKLTERQLARLILDLARNKSELVQMREVSSGEPLITEGIENGHVYLVLSGRLHVYRHGRPLCDESGAEVEVLAGGVAGEIAALRGGAASATVAGDGVVLAIGMSVVREHLEKDRAFKLGMEELTKYHLD